MSEELENKDEERECCKIRKKCGLITYAILILTFMASASALVGVYQVNKKIDLILDAINLGPKKQQQAQAQRVNTDEVLISKKYDNKGQTLEKAMKKNKPVLTFFYVDWCGYCKRFAPTFHKLSKDRDILKKYEVAYVNCEDAKNEKTVKEFAIQGFPSVFVVKNGEKNQIDNNKLFEEFEDLKKDLLD